MEQDKKTVLAVAVAAVVGYLVGSYEERHKVESLYDCYTKLLPQAKTSRAVIALAQACRGRWGEVMMKWEDMEKVPTK